MRLLLMIVAIGAVVAGGLYYVFRVHAPDRDYSLARAEIERWEEREAKVRRCLLGTSPASPIAAEALAIRELTSTSSDFKLCTAGIGELSRGNTPDTGLKEVEDEWRGLNKAASGLARTFAQLFVPKVNQAGALDDLGDALDTLDVAHSNLRQAAGMDPEPTGTNAKPSLPKAELIALGTAKRAKLSAWLRPSASGLVVLVEGAGRPMQQLVLRPGQPPRRVPYKGDVRPSISDPAWAVEAGDGELAYGKLMADGSIEATAKRSVGDKKAVPHLLFTLGTGAHGAIAYLPDAAREAPQVALARVGPELFEAGTPVDSEDYAFAVDPPNRGLLAWSRNNAMRGVIVDLATTAPVEAPAAGSGAPPVARLAPPPRAIELGAGHTGLSCLTKTHGWMASGEQFVAFDATTSARIALPGFELIGCDATAMLAREAGHRYAACSVVPGEPTASGAAPAPAVNCRAIDLAAGAEALPGLAGGKAIAVASRQRVLAVWREQAEVRYFVMPASFRPKLVQATAMLVEVLGETDDGLAVVRANL